MNHQLTLPGLKTIRNHCQLIHTIPKLHRFLIVHRFTVNVKQGIGHMYLKSYQTFFRALSLVLIQINRCHLFAFHFNHLAVTIAIICYRQLIAALRHFKRHIRCNLCIYLCAKTDPAALEQLRIHQRNRPMTGRHLNRQNLFIQTLHTDHVVLTNLIQRYFLIS